MSIVTISRGTFSGGKYLAECVAEQLGYECISREVLAGVRHVVRVRAIANMEFRIFAAMQRLRIGREEAIAYIKKVDKERERWTRFLYGVNWHDPSLYDVILNLEHMSLRTACDVVISLVNSESFQPTPASLKALEDLALGSRVWAALNTDPRTASADVKATADGGVVTITGTARLEEVVEAIPAVAREVEGVKEVRCQVGIGSFFLR